MLDNAEVLKRCLRIFHIARKPTPDEFNKVAKVTALGMAVCGVIGFVLAALLAVA